jgi:hypothetical protein
MPIREHPERGRPGVGKADCLLIGRRALLRHEGIEGSRQLGVVPFAGEGSPPMGEAIGAELDGRLFTDLSPLQPENPITPSRQFRAFLATKMNESANKCPGAYFRL